MNTHIRDFQRRLELVATRVIVSNLLLLYKEGQGVKQSAMAIEDLSRAFAEFGDLHLLGAYSLDGLLLCQSPQSRGRLPRTYISHSSGSKQAVVSVPYMRNGSILLDVTTTVFAKVCLLLHWLFPHFPGSCCEEF